MILSNAERQKRHRGRVKQTLASLTPPGGSSVIATVSWSLQHHIGIRPLEISLPKDMRCKGIGLSMRAMHGPEPYIWSGFVLPSIKLLAADLATVGVQLFHYDPPAVFLWEEGGEIRISVPVGYTHAELFELLYETEMAP